jgi:hypothetical protein
MFAAVVAEPFQNFFLGFHGVTSLGLWRMRIIRSGLGKYGLEEMYGELLNKHSVVRRL